MGDLLESCRAVAGSDAELVWMNDEFLLEHGAGPWMELPLWLAPEDAPLLQVDVSRALAAGLRFRPLEETIADTLAWAREETAHRRARERARDRRGRAWRPRRRHSCSPAWRSR